MESEDEVTITENDVMDIMEVFTRVPPLILKNGCQREQKCG